MGLDNPLHIAFLVVILLLVFGAKRLPEIGRSLGSGMREFKDSISGDRPDTAQQQQALPQATQSQEAPVAPPAAAAAPAAPPAQAPAEPTRQA
jgi:sec-independent protein translocase protein TatA